MSSPHRSDCHPDRFSTAPARSYVPARSSAPGKIFRNRESHPNWKSPDPNSRTPGIHPARCLLSPLTFPWRFPRYVTTRLPRKGGYPRTRKGLSLLRRIFRRHQHPPLGCLPASPECSKYTQLTANCPRRTLPDSVGFPTRLPSDRIRHFRQVHFSLGYTKLRRSCASPDYTAWNSVSPHGALTAHKHITLT